jgi:ABC-type Na+ efflux pump permease subunit
MRFSQAWLVARHDIRLIRTRKGILIGLIAFPLAVGIGFPLLIDYIATSGGAASASYLPQLIDAFSFWFVIAGASLPTSIAAYAIVGEKVEKSLEPLLSTPTTDGEILLGKVLAAFIPTLLAIWAGSIVFMALTDWAVWGVFGHLYFPNTEMAVILLALAPLACLYSVEVSIVVSSRVTDVRSAQQYAGVVFLPLILLYVAGEIGEPTLNTENLLIISGIFVVIVFALFQASTRTFHREEILTRWK